MTQAMITSLAVSLALTILLEVGFFLLIRLFVHRRGGNLPPVLLDAECSHRCSAEPTGGRLPPLQENVQHLLKKDLLLLILVNILTNPIVVLIYWLTVLYTDWNTVIMIAALEIFVVLIEGYCYKKYGRGFKHPYTFSVAANMFSYWIGVILQLIT